jgi:hypothetical protein
MPITLNVTVLKERNVVAVVLFHRKGAEDAKCDYFLFAAERPANKKTQALRAKHKFDLQIA